MEKTFFIFNVAFVEYFGGICLSSHVEILLYPYMEFASRADNHMCSNYHRSYLHVHVLSKSRHSISPEAQIIHSSEQ